MIKKNLLPFVGSCIIATFVLFNLYGQTGQGESDILASLAKDEVYIELFRSEDNTIDIRQSEIENPDIIKKELGCAGKLRKGTKALIKNEDEEGLFVIDGIITEKTPEYVIFSGKIEFTSKDKKHHRETVVNSKLIKGKVHILGGIKKSSEKSEFFLMRAIW